jgi:hypothetical protein
MEIITQQTAEADAVKVVVQVGKDVEHVKTQYTIPCCRILASTDSCRIR